MHEKNKNQYKLQKIKQYNTKKHEKEKEKKGK